VIRVVLFYGLLAIAAALLDRFAGDWTNDVLSSLPGPVVFLAATLGLIVGLWLHRRSWNRILEKQRRDFEQLGIGTPKQVKALLDEIDPLLQNDPEAAQRRLLEYKHEHPGPPPN
jgi:hypothetical protein